MSYPEEIMMNYQKRLKSINAASFSDFNPDEQSSFLIKGEADSDKSQDQSNSKGRESVSSSDKLTCVLNIKHLTIEADTVTIYKVGSTSSTDIQKSKIPRSAQNTKSKPSTSSQSIQSKGSTNSDVKETVGIIEPETFRQSQKSRHTTDKKNKKEEKKKKN